jgi:hypothetical protein
MLLSSDAGVADAVGVAVGVGVGVCALNAPVAITVSATAMKNPFRALPKTLPINPSRSKTISFGKQNFLWMP